MPALTLKELKTPLELEERTPLEPAADEVVVQLEAAALNRRDYWITQGMYPDIKLPVVLGSDGAGTVTKCGEEVDSDWLHAEVIIHPGLQWGDSEEAQSPDFHILGMPRDGTFATEVTVPATQLHAKPEHLSWAEAAALPLAGVTAWRALFTQGRLQAGDRILITGAGGGVAAFALQFAVAAGAEVWVTSSSDEKISRAVGIGVRGGFNYREEDWWKQMLQTAGPPAVIIDSAGGAGYASLIKLVAPGGRIVNYGATAGAPEKLDLFKVFWKQIHLIGSTMGSPGDFTSMLKLVNERQLKPIVEDVMPLADGNEALQRMQSSPQFGKYVLSIGE